MNAERLLDHFEQISEAPDAVARLRRFILDLAVRGKLVEQDPEDEPASELLRLIELQKRLTLRNKPDIRSKHIAHYSSSDLPFEAPQGWTWVHLGDILLKLTDGTHHSPPNGPTGDFLYITAKNIKPDGIALRDVTYVARDVHEEIYSRCNPEKGDILYIKDGATTGVATINDLTEPFSLLSSVALLKLPDGIFNAFLLHFLRSPFLYQQMRGFMKGGAIPRVTLKRMAPALLPLPPLGEQHRIVAKVDELMALCDQLEAARQQREQHRERLVSATLQRLNQPAEDPITARNDARFALQVLTSITTTTAQIKQLRQTILNLAVRGKLVEQDPQDEPAEELSRQISLERKWLAKTGVISLKKPASRDPAGFIENLPEIWDQLALGELCNLVTSGSRGWAEFYSESGAGFIRAQNIRFGCLRLDDMAYVQLPPNSEGSRTKVEVGDLLVVITGAGATNPALLDQDIGEAYVSQHVSLIRPTDKTLSPWLLLCLMAPAGGRNELVERAYGSGKPGLNLDNIRSLTIPLPPLAEQHRIVAKVDQLMALCDQLEQQLIQADQQRRRLLEALLAEALGGRLDAEVESHADAA